MSDAELVERARRGDRDAFGELVERHQQAVFRTALAALRSREEAEEVAQDAFIAAMQKLDDFRGDASFKTWLLTIAWHKAIDRRRGAAEWFRRFISRDQHESPEPASAQPSHEQALIDAEGRGLVRRMLRGLPGKYRDPLLLSVSGDHTFEEIAALLGIPTGTAKWRAMEGRRLLKEKIRRWAGGGTTEGGGRKAGGGTTGERREARDEAP